MSDTANPVTEAGRRLLRQTLGKRITPESIVAIEEEARSARLDIGRLAAAMALHKWEWLGWPDHAQGDADVYARVNEAFRSAAEAVAATYAALAPSVGSSGTAEVERQRAESDDFQAQLRRLAAFVGDADPALLDAFVFSENARQSVAEQPSHPAAPSIGEAQR